MFQKQIGSCQKGVVLLAHKNANKIVIKVKSLASKVTMQVNNFDEKNKAVKIIQSKKGGLCTKKHLFFEISPKKEVSFSLKFPKGNTPSLSWEKINKFVKVHTFCKA
ncbi:MAG: hypothetical protein V1652_00145 [bacterium]